MRRVLVISPHFPPVNAPDMQRIRMSLPYFAENNWEPVIISVDEKYVNGYLDNDLLDTIPAETEIHKTKALSDELTRWFGVGNIALRSIYHIYKKGCELLNSRKFDLIFFTTSNFYVCALGPVWKSKFKVPFIIDFQDPWYNEALSLKNGSHTPRKQKISYSLHKKLERFTIPESDGIITVSQGYIDNIKNKYQLYNKPSEVINFGGAEHDYKVVSENRIIPFPLEEDKINVIYPGALTPYFLPVIRAFFKAFNESELDKTCYRFYFIGTTYFRAQKGILNDFINNNDLQELVFEYPERITYFETLATMQAADIILMPGSTDGDYNPSKICNAIMSGTSVFAVYDKRSIVHDLINASKSGIAVVFESGDTEEVIYLHIRNKIEEFKHLHKIKNNSHGDLLSQYSARNLTKRICNFFDKVILS